MGRIYHQITSVRSPKSDTLLEKGEDERLESINQVLQPVYAESLKRKAAQLGDVVDVSEGTRDGQYELTIKVSR